MPDGELQREPARRRLTPNWHSGSHARVPINSPMVLLRRRQQDTQTPDGSAPAAPTSADAAGVDGSLSALSYIGRQPIFDAKRRTYAHQLLSRSSDANSASFADGDAATRELVEHALFQFGVERLLAGRPALVHVGAGFLRSGLYRAVPPEQLILELLADVDTDETTRALAIAARAEGYRLALDDVVRGEQVASPDLLAIVDIVKIDVSVLDDAALVPTVRTLRAQAPAALVLAERVEDQDRFRTTVEAGFDLFQGYFFARPEVLSRGTRSLSSTAAMALIAEVQKPDLSMRRLEQLVLADATLAYRLLTLVNSGLVGLSNRVDSVYHALVLLGAERVRQLATLITLASQRQANQELVALGVTRAGMARVLHACTAEEGDAYTAGLLSVLDAVFGVPMTELVGELPLPPGVARALIERAGPLGELLDALEAYERGDLATLERLRPGRLADFIRAYTDAIRWSDQLRMQLAAATA